MKLHFTAVVVSSLLSLVTESDGAAFVPHAVSYSRASTTAVRLTDWEDATPDTSRSRLIDPSKNVQSYLSAPKLSADVRPNLDGTVLVSGFINEIAEVGGGRDQRIFDLLNGYGEGGMDDGKSSPFRFDKIVAFVDDVPLAKKRLISRSARYSGLLNKLEFVQSSMSAEASAGRSLPTPEQLAGVKNWVAHVGSDLSLISEIGQLVRSSSVENVCVLVTSAFALDVYESEEAVRALAGSGKTFTVVAVGKEDPTIAEGVHPYAIREFGTKGGKIPSGSTFSRDEGLRLAAECLGLRCAADRALSFTQVMDVNATETKLINGLREAGYGWTQEIEHMIDGGVNKFDEACRVYEEKKKASPFAGMGWMEDAEEKLRKAQEEEMERQAAREAEWLREREESMEAERVKVEEGLAEWA